ncbi:MAG: hypothetical protein L6V81_07590 [Clostridium sp.]|nr:MAG: hypothetical protein L6V81_07590 [Clostridium sp.]
MSPEFIRKFESTRGSEGLSLLSLYKISIVLGTSIDKFFGKRLPVYKEIFNWYI